MRAARHGIARKGEAVGVEDGEDAVCCDDSNVVIAIAVEVTYCRSADDGGRECGEWRGLVGVVNEVDLSTAGNGDELIVRVAVDIAHGERLDAVVKGDTARDFR